MLVPRRVRKTTGTFHISGGSQISIPVIGVEIPLEFILGMVFIFSNLITRAVGLPLFWITP